MDYFGDEDTIGIAGKVVSPVLAMCILIFMQECSRCLAEDDKMHHSPTKTLVETTHTRNHHVGRKRSTAPVYSALADQPPAPKKARSTENVSALGDAAGELVTSHAEQSCRCAVCAGIGESPPNQLLEDIDDNNQQPPLPPLQPLPPSTPSPHLLVDSETGDEETDSGNDTPYEEDDADADTVVLDPVWMDNHLEEIKHLSHTEIDEYLHKQAIELLKTSETELKQMAKDYYKDHARRAQQKMDKVLVHANEELEHIIELEKQVTRKRKEEEEELNKLLEIEEESVRERQPLDEHELNKFADEDDDDDGDTAEKNGSS